MNKVKKESNINNIINSKMNLEKQILLIGTPCKNKVMEGIKESMKEQEEIQKERLYKNIQMYLENLERNK